ncbi:hypothetical protein [Hydrogenophaga sp.]|uniref:hypothetical protein n=1 Tax=Hydrogenophaga sp. TaxID=1904254 RepID=UPI0035B45755
MNVPPSQPSDNEHDRALRQRLQAALSEPSSDDMRALQDRVITQWRQGQPHQPVMAGGGPVAALQAAWRQHPLRWTGAVLVLALGLWLLRPVQDPALDELMQPDVLSLISMGEL